MIKPFVSGGFGSLIVMNKLFLQKRYDEILDFFEKQLNDYSAENSFSEMSEQTFRQAIPYDQLTCVIAVFLALVIKFYYLKEFLWVFK